MEPKEFEGKKYAPVPIAKILPDHPLCTDVYVFYKDTMLKYRSATEEITSERYNLFLAKEVRTIYIACENLQVFMDWLKEAKSKEMDAIIKEVGEENREFVEKKEELKEKIYETFVDQELNSDNVLLLQETTSNIISDISSKKVPAEVLANISKVSGSMADHAVNVANMAVFLAMTAGNGHQFVLENVYLGGLFHDYAKSKIPPKILEDQGSPRYSQAIQDHPQKGAQMIAKIESIPKQVQEIVLQHHEQFNGQGYPQGLKDDEIYNLAKFVSMANVIDNVLVENKKRPSEMHKIALKVLKYDRGKNFDPELLPRAFEGLQFAWNNNIGKSNNVAD